PRARGTPCSWPRRARASTSFRTTSSAGESSRSWCAASASPRRPKFRKRFSMRRNEMPRRLEHDRWLFVVTLAMCLLGAVMIFSASAVTAEHEYGHSYIFLMRQAAWLGIGLGGMFVLMRTDYRRLREPAVVYSVLCTVGLLLVAAFFLDKSHATPR